MSRAALAMLEWLRRTPAERWLAALGVLSVTIVAVCLNVLAGRFYVRWDWTSDGLYTLSAPTIETLQNLDEPVEVIVFLSRADPLTTSVRHVLTAYSAQTRQLRIRYADPDRDPAEFIALQKQYRIQAGRAEDGRVVTDAALVLAQGDRRWFVTPQDLVRIDPEDGSARPMLEQALTEGLRNVLDRERALVCFTTGHREVRSGDAGDTGLAELVFRLEKNNFDVVSIDLTKPQPGLRLDDCRVVAIVGPEIPFAARAAERVARYLRAGGNVLIAANPIIDDEMRPLANGLDPIAVVGGIQLGGDTVVERDPAAKLTGGVGERFFARAVPHALTSGVQRDGEPLFRVLVTVAQSVRGLEGAAPAPILTTSDQAFSVTDIRPFLAGAAVQPRESDPRGPFTVAMANELERSGETAHGPRLVIFGTSSLAWGESFRDPGLMGNRLLVESAFSWLAAEPALVTVPEKSRVELDVALTEESLTSVWRYVILYMPATALLIGALILYRRRSVERASRRGASRQGASRRGPGAGRTKQSRSAPADSEHRPDPDQRDDDSEGGAS